MKDSGLKRIAVIVAMEEEILPLLKRLGAKERKDYFGSDYPMKAYEAQMGNLEILFSTNGRTIAPKSKEAVNLIGSVPAVVNTLKTYEIFRPDLMISSGTAGGFVQRGAEIGDVYLGETARFHDRRISLPGFEEIAQRSWPLCFSEKLKTELQLKSGIISTADSFDMSKDDEQEMTRFGADVKEMEAAAIAMTASFFGLPVIGLKAITDLVDSSEATAQSQFLKHLEKACENLCLKLEETLNLLSQKGLQQF